MKLVSILLLLLFGTLDTSNVVEGQTCKTLQFNPRQFFSIPSFLGIWYTQGFGFFDSDNVAPAPYKCVVFDYSAGQLNHLISDQTLVDLESGLTIRETDDVVVDNIGQPALWTVYTNTTGTLLASEAVILHTDHHTFAIQYYCTIVDGVKHERIVTWSRQPQMDAQLTHFLEVLMVGYGIPKANQVTVDQINCA